MHAIFLAETAHKQVLDELAFLTTDIFASFGVLPLLHLRASHCKIQQFIPVVICILVILSFQQ